MSYLKEIEVKLGCSVGDFGESRAPIVQTFHEMGLDKIRPGTVTKLRTSYEYGTSGTRTLWRMAAAEILLANDASLKNSLYCQIASEGLNQRRCNGSLASSTRILIVIPFHSSISIWFCLTSLATVSPSMNNPGYVSRSNFGNSISKLTALTL